MDDTSLDDFLDGEDGDGSDTDRSTTTTPADEAGQTDGPVEAKAAPTVEGEKGDSDDSVAPATTTSRWVGDGIACPVCETSAKRLWESADGFVCPTCKEW
jgi:rubredoxin